MLRYLSADRAIFMERGRVQFQGPAQELLERDDLLRCLPLRRRCISVMSILAGILYSNEILFQGFIDGLVYALIAMGLVLIYKATGVINFAQELSEPLMALLWAC